MKTVSGILKSMRPLDALLKNGFVVAALVFGKKVGDPGSLAHIALAYLLFWLTSCCVYILNDVIDRASDREHPAKRLRPIASGALGVRAAFAFAAAALGGVMGASALLGAHFSAALGAYLGLNVAYSLVLKELVLIDAMAVATGFLLRVVGGGAAIGVEIRPWLLVSTLLIALLLAFAKRRHELVLLGDNAREHRGVLASYSPYLLDQIITIIAAATLLTYTLYTMDHETVLKYGTTRLPYTVPFVLYGVFRYLFLVHRKDGGGQVGRTLLADPPLLVDIFLWCAAVVLIIYVWP